MKSKLFTTILILSIVVFTIPSFAQVEPLGWKAATAVMTAGPMQGVAPQTILGSLGAIFIHDVVIYNALLDPITGDPMEPPAYFQQYPDAGELFLFGFDNIPSINFTYANLKSYGKRYGLQSEASADDITYKVDPYRLPGTYRYPKQR